MCGINGFWGRPDRELLEAMAVAQRHRGPDDDGFFECEHASLGFRRLSIIDVSGGHEPMWTDDELLHLVYNGEVYNFRELRAELEPLGHRFKTHCDAEVVLHAYEEWGGDCFARFNGMWAVAILDRRTPDRRLILCRDHFGIKPLYYANSDGRTLFASEIKSILQDPRFARRVNESRMYDYLAHGFFDHDTATFFEGVRQVPAAAYVVVDDDGVSEHRYWEPVLSEDGSADPDEFRALFEKAVERRLVSDVPVGICLSGGLDSGSIVSVMARLLEQHVPDSVSLGDRLKTFSAVFPNDPIDESDYIRAALKTTGADSAWCEPTADDFIEELEAWVWHVEEPMVSSAPYAMWQVARLAAKQVTVVLDGQGGDELLGGYDHYPYVYVRDLWRRHRRRDAIREAWKARDIVVPLIRRRLGERRRRVDIHALLRPDFIKGKQRPRDERVVNDLKVRLLQDFATYSLPPLLRYEDRNSMAHSLEARLPFLDQDLVEHILRLPAEAIIRNGVTRAILRDALVGILPEKIHRRRKKIGFTTPEFRWYRRQRAALQSLMRSPSFAARSFWDAPALAVAFREACAGNTEENLIFWRAINVEVWMRVFFDDAARQLDAGSLHAGFIRRGDIAVAAAYGDVAQRVFAVGRANPGRHLFMRAADGDVYARLPLRSSLIGRGDDLVAAIVDCIDALVTRGAPPQDGDVLLVSEKSLAISQGRAFPVDEVRVSRLAGLLSRFVTRTPGGVGIGHPVTMQLAVREAGRLRVLAAALVAALARPLGKHGVFYRVAGARVNAIDGPSKFNLPPYDTWAVLAPSDPESAARHIAAELSRRYAVRIRVAVIDASDFGAEIFATSGAVDTELVRELVADNPLGQSDEQTPFGLVRRVTRTQARSEPEFTAAAVS
ncbi:MAG TPA: asparagine synthase (glutamine-hydrolyzing) [Candidatus Dormibacteraeota bacterium]|jgi:asparagine synthase (glutamine-hydrolysing)|nr:asparagine synthase (glutamine-hydrolyzing) [Candidatus Dormibacteraeota bacterium]